MSVKTSGRAIGALLLIAFFVYGGGSALVHSVTGTPVVLADVVGSETRLTAGGPDTQHGPPDSQSDPSLGAEA